MKGQAALWECVSTGSQTHALEKGPECILVMTECECEDGCKGVSGESACSVWVGTIF